MEATESAEVVLQYYEELLKEDATNTVSPRTRYFRIALHNTDYWQAAWKRRISILRRTGKYEKAVAQLSKFLDTFYTDLEGWLELADIYSSCNQLSILLPIYCPFQTSHTWMKIHTCARSSISCFASRPSEPLYLFAICRDGIYRRRPASRAQDVPSGGRNGRKGPFQ